MSTDPPPIDPLPEKDDGATLYVHILAMGSGDSILVMMPESTKPNEYRYKNILIDIGKPGYVDLEKYLTHFHVTKLDGLIITHPHQDHSFQIDRYYKKYNPIMIWLTEYFWDSESFKNESYQEFIIQLIADDRIKKVFPAENAEIITNCRDKPISLKLIWPTTKYRNENMRQSDKDLGWGFSSDTETFQKLDLNDSSLGIIIEYLGHKIFTTGDMVEHAWKEFNQKIDCQGYKIAHHGALNGTTDDTEKKVKFQAIGSDKKATYAVATENPSNKRLRGLPSTVINHLKGSGVGEIYSVRYDRSRPSPRPVSYIIAITPKKNGEAICNLIRYYAIDEKQRDEWELVKAEGKDYYKQKGDNPIRRTQTNLEPENENEYTTEPLTEQQQQE